MENLSPILILGLGNEILSDDGIGIRLISEFMKIYCSPVIHFQSSSKGGMEIIEIMTGYSQVIIIDAIKTKNGKPGTVYHLTPADFSDTSNISSFHDISFLTALKFAELVDIKIPKKIHILAIEIVEDMVFSDRFSPVINNKYNQIKRRIGYWLNQIIPENYIPDRENTLKLFS